MAQLPGHCAAFRNVGKLRSVRGLMRADMPAFVGETCTIGLQTGEQLMAEVVGFDETESQLMCFDSTAGLHPGLEITATGHSRAVPVGNGLLGRVIDGIGRPIDGHGPLRQFDAGDQKQLQCRMPCREPGLRNHSSPASV